MGRERMPEANVFVTEEAVRKACQEHGLSDWSKKSGGNVDHHEAEVIRKQVGAEAMDIPLEAFRIGLKIELEHGTRYPDANVTGNHPIATGLIVLAHLKESLDYYTRLQCMELEMELDNALASGDADRAFAKRRALAEARSELEDVVSDRLKPGR
jgi:hypothetical protein